jgi:hypothetical protein
MDGSGEVGVPHARELLAFADAALTFDAATMAAPRDAAWAAVGEAALVDAAAVIGGFNGIVRIADAMGIPLEDAKAADSAEWRASLRIDEYAKLKT